MDRTANDTEEAMTEDELRLVRSLRTWLGVPFISVLSGSQKAAFEAFLGSLRVDTRQSSAIH